MATSTPAAKLQEADENKLALEGLDGDEGDKNEKGGEAKTEEELAAEAAEAERLKPIEKEDGSMETDIEAKARVEAEDVAAAEAAKKPTEVEKLTGEVKDLRQILRTSKRDQVQMQAKMDRLEKRPVKAEEEEEEEDEDGKPIKKEVKEEPLSHVEELQGAISQIGTERGASLDILLATMEQGSYKDIREVCSRGNFDDIFEAIASESSKDSGKSYDEALLEVELSVWAKENPYKYMYDLVKKYHPSYIKKEELAKPGEKGKKEPVVADAPGSIADKGGDSTIKAGWTADRIDKLDEDELSTVPEEVYDKYLKGELD